MLKIQTTGCWMCILYTGRIWSFAPVTHVWKTADGTSYLCEKHANQITRELQQRNSDSPIPTKLEAQHG